MGGAKFIRYAWARNEPYPLRLLGHNESPASYGLGWAKSTYQEWTSRVAAISRVDYVGITIRLAPVTFHDEQDWGVAFNLTRAALRARRP